MSKLYIIGVGPGSPELLTPQARTCIQELSFVVGLERVSKSFEQLEQVVCAASLSDLVERTAQALSVGDAGVLVSGSATFHSFGAYLKRKFPQHELCVIQGISSIEYLLAKAALFDADIAKRSLHGAELNPATLISDLKRHAYVAYLLDPQHKPEVVATTLVEAGYPELKLVVGENLSYEDERIVRGPAQEIAAQHFGELCVVVVQGIAQGVVAADKTAAPLFGRGEHAFERAEHVPLTKGEVRAVALSKLELFGCTEFWDVGAGTGSVAIEVALLCPTARVYAFEKNERALAVIAKNAAAYGVTHQITAVSGLAPESFAAAGEPSHVFIGGSAGKLEEILAYLTNLNQKVRVVISAATLKTAARAEQLLSAERFQGYEMVQVSVSRNKALGGYQLMSAENSVYLASATYVPTDMRTDMPADTPAQDADNDAAHGAAH